MKTLWNEAHRAEVLQRIEAITPQRAPNWGRMDASRMVAHVGDWFRMALGELPIAERWLPVRYFPLKQLLIFVLPFPKNLPTAPELRLVRSAALHPTPVLSEELPLATTPIVRDALEKRTVISMPDAGLLTAAQPFLAAFPFSDHLARRSVLLVQDMPFEQFNWQSLARIEFVLSLPVLFADGPGA